MSPFELLCRYATFAALATVANLGAQRVVLRLGEPIGILPIAMVTGTAVGLGIKYLLDKRWIFRDGARGFRAHRDRFSRYTLMGLATTAVFWGVETSFWLVWRSEGMRELGAILGLGIGYWAKYHLDRRFVFSAPAVVAEPADSCSGGTGRGTTQLQ